jgi:Tfp pilus assembly protein PilN
VSMQQINLLNPQLLTPRVAFSSQTIALMLLAVVALGLVLYAVVESSASGIKQQLDRAQAMRDQVQAKIDALVKTPAQEQASEDKLAQAVAQERKHIANLKTLQAALGAAQDKTSFSSRLRAFAHEGWPGVWLTGFEIGEQEFRLEGRALRTASIPDYLALLARQPALKDLPLTSFSITSPGTEGEKTQAEGVAFAVNPATVNPAAETK